MLIDIGKLSISEDYIVKAEIVTGTTMVHASPQSAKAVEIQLVSGERLTVTNEDQVATILAWIEANRWQPIAHPASVETRCSM